MSDITDANISLSEAKKHLQDTGTLCHQNDTTNTKFCGYWWNQTSNICRKMNIFSEFFTSIGLSKRQEEIYQLYNSFLLKGLTFPRVYQPFVIREVM
jgi:hypothetical protein